MLYSLKELGATEFNKPSLFNNFLTSVNTKTR